MLRCVRQERHGARSFDGNREAALVLSARAALAVTDDLLTIVQVIPQEVYILIVDYLDTVAAKVTGAAAPGAASARTASALTAKTTLTAEPSRRPASRISSTSVYHH
jgi:hypothetical protein